MSEITLSIRAVRNDIDKCVDPCCRRRHSCWRYSGAWGDINQSIGDMHMGVKAECEHYIKGTGFGGAWGQ